MKTSRGNAMVAHSPECVEGVFSEVRMHDLAYPAPESREDGLRVHPLRRTGAYILWCCMDMRLGGWAKARSGCFDAAYFSQKGVRGGSSTTISVAAYQKTASLDRGL